MFEAADGYADDEIVMFEHFRWTAWSLRNAAEEQEAGEIEDADLGLEESAL